MKTWKILLSGIVLLGIIVALLVYFFIYNKPHRDYERASPDFELKAEELYFAFVNDENLAGEQYNGKILLLTGEAAMVEQIDEMIIVSFVFEEGIFGDEGVRCTMLQSQHSDALKLKEGQSVRVKGLCTGFTGSDVVLEHCSIVR
jgi:hypothetical protein